MKKMLGTVAAIAALIGAGSPQVQANVQQGAKQQQTRDAIDKTPRTVRQGRPTALNPTGSMPEYFTPLPASRTPKEYGQWLQMTGRQKWVKSKRK